MIIPDIIAGKAPYLAIITVTNAAQNSIKFIGFDQ